MSKHIFCVELHLYIECDSDDPTPEFVDQEILRQIETAVRAKEPLNYTIWETTENQ